jgi:hypothetical protein
VIFLLAVLLWWTVEAVMIGSPSFAGNSGNYLLGSVLAIIQFNYWIPTIAVAAIADFAFSFFPRPWSSLAYLGFLIAVLAAVSFFARGIYQGEMRTENFHLLIYPAIAVSVLYLARNFARGPA